MPTSVARPVCDAKTRQAKPGDGAVQATGDGSSWDPVNDFLVNCLHRTDELLLAYLDGDNDLTLNTIQRLRMSAHALLAGSMTPRQVADEWADWFLLTPAFIAAYGTWKLADLESDARLLRNRGAEDNPRLTEAGRVYLSALEVALDAYPEMRTTR